MDTREEEFVYQKQHVVRGCVTQSRIILTTYHSSSEKLGIGSIKLTMQDLFLVEDFYNQGLILEG